MEPLELEGEHSEELASVVHGLFLFVCEPIQQKRKGAVVIRWDARRMTGRTLAMMFCLLPSAFNGRSQSEIADSIGVSRAAFSLHVNAFRLFYKMKSSAFVRKRARP
jgi:hypothetical protein